MSPPTFFAFNPRQPRFGFAVGALLCAVTTAWAAAASVRSGEVSALARTGVSAGLLLAFVYALVRLRPRDGWGVSLSEEDLTVARPLSGAPIRVPWSQIASVRRTGKRDETLVVFLQGESRVLIARHLFATGPAFEALVAAVTTKVPPPMLDA